MLSLVRRNGTTHFECRPGVQYAVARVNDPGAPQAIGSKVTSASSGSPAGFIITRNGVPVVELGPLRRRFASRAAVEVAMADAPAVDGARFRADLGSLVDQGTDPPARAHRTRPRAP